MNYFLRSWCLTTRKGVAKAEPKNRVNLRVSLYLFEMSKGIVCKRPERRGYHG